MNIDACVAAYGVTAAISAPYLLGRCSAIQGTPRLGVAIWLLAALSVLGSWLAAGVSLAYHPGAIAQTAGIALFGGLSLRLAWAWIVTWYATRSNRARHAQAAALLGRRDPAIGAVVLESPEPAAYCLPHTGGGTVVVTTGARAALSTQELSAVLSHERAHLDGHHHLLVGLGQILARALPVPVLFREVGRQVPRLLEMRADDAAARVHGADTVAAAIANLSSQTTPAGTLGAGGTAATIRALRLIGTEPTALRGRLTLVATAIVLAAGPFLAALPACPHPW